MSDFKAKMHQIVCRLGLRRRPRWGAYSAPQIPSWILEGLLLRGKGKGKGRDGKGEEGRGEEGRGEEGKEKGEGRDGEWRDGEGRGQGRPPS